MGPFPGRTANPARPAGGAILIERPRQRDRKLCFGDFELSPGCYELRRCGQRLAVEPRVLEVLVHLVSNSGRVISKDELWQVVWHGRAVSDAAISKQIREARRALSGPRNWIKTVYGRGVIFVGDVRTETTGEAPREGEPAAAGSSGAFPSSIESSRCSWKPEEAGDERLSAFDLRLRAAQRVHCGTRQSCQEALSLYRRAARLDPASARAWIGVVISGAHLALRYASPTIPIAQVENALRRAQQLDPHAPGAKHAQGLTHWLRGECERAACELEEALQVDSSLEECLIDFSLLCCLRGEHHRAARIVTDDVWANNTDYQVLFFAARNHMYCNEDAKARELHERGICAVQQHLEVYPNDVRAWSLGGAVLANIGHPRRALEWSEVALRSASQESLVWFNGACVFAANDEVERSLTMLERAFSLGAPLDWARVDRDLEPVRKNRRFRQMLSNFSSP